jgi:hypothetical protein
MNSDWDYICIGATGFAQVGSPDYHEKQLAEKAVLLDYFKKKHPVPDEFSSLCVYFWKSFPHDFGTYHELVILYDRFEIDYLEDGEENLERHNRFYKFLNDCQSEDLDTEELIEKIRALFVKNTLQNEETDPHLKSQSFKEKQDPFVDSLDALNLDEETLLKIRAIHFGELDPSVFKSVNNWIQWCYKRPKDDEIKMFAYNEILEGYGIEGHEGEWQNGYWCNIEFTYVNMGDSYIPTIVHHREKGWLVTSYGDLVEDAVCSD